MTDINKPEEQGKVQKMPDLIKYGIGAIVGASIALFTTLMIQNSVERHKTIENGVRSGNYASISDISNGINRIKDRGSIHSEAKDIYFNLHAISQDIMKNLKDNNYAMIDISSNNKKGIILRDYSDGSSHNDEMTNSDLTSVQHVEHADIVYQFKEGVHNGGKKFLSEWLEMDFNLTNGSADIRLRKDTENGEEKMYVENLGSSQNRFFSSTNKNMLTEALQKKDADKYSDIMAYLRRFYYKNFTEGKLDASKEFIHNVKIAWKNDN